MSKTDQIMIAIARIGALVLCLVGWVWFVTTITSAP